MTASECQTCDKARNCINGKWCSVLKVYVEYSNKAKCKIS